MRRRRQINDIVFVYLGPAVPAYLPGALGLARKHSGLEVTLLANAHARDAVAHLGINFVPTEDFYEPTGFEAAARNVELDHNFRGGFWVRTLERFFVLEQFMAADSRAFVFHAEADQLLFGVDALSARLRGLSSRGLYFPFHSPTKAVASIFFCNSAKALRTLLQTAREGAPFGNEMELLVRWAAEFPNFAHPLPTLGDEPPFGSDAGRAHHPALVDRNRLGGIVDAAELGLWVGGRDPRNLEIASRPKTKFTYPEGKATLTKSQLQELVFYLDSSDRMLMVELRGTGEKVRLYNLHLHSKVHAWLWTRDRDLSALFRRANHVRPAVLPGTRRAQVSYRARKRIKKLSRKTARLARGAAGRISSELVRAARAAKRLHANTAGSALAAGNMTLARVVSPRISREGLRSAIAAYNPASDDQVALAGQSIAIIGPGFVGSSDRILDQFDVIARIGFTGGSSSHLSLGGRCDLSFLAKWHAKSLLEALNAGTEGLEGVKLVFRHDVEPDDARTLSRFFPTDYLSTDRCDRLFSKVVPNFAPQIILWLLSLQPKSLHVSHIDLMTDSRRPNGYATNKAIIEGESFWRHSKDTMRHSFARFHNPFTHFSFFQALESHPSVTFSRQLHEIIRGGSRAYGDTLSRLYY